ncbi:sugar ABC transporter substrate-binding protein [Bifidobacterium lemurum]|uniref:Sugar ABC transporter substrate-binding protein n=1 Tax=Bifidobacterium lemurum TaxID=1603886 RepID=A0A261FV63_9BIFI|nr:ABC transporter substrate-binding protein [Bifidobacterium lemurum]OZG63052.1 sugar ABC transporter substrate-binding protein [Bifidobacterium lemurum]QOL33386.1 carbohydrate ABC transporter substrate-binding protein [Bifidobacterium lemurum]
MFNAKKVVAALGALAMSVGLLAGCGSSSSSDEGTGTADDPVTLTFWTWQPTDTQWETIYAEFQKEYPNIKIDWWRTSEMSDYQKKLQTAMAGGEGPDVFGLQAGSTVEQYGRFAADMQELADQYMSGWDSEVSEGAVEQVTDADGKLVAMPTITSGSEYLLYNKTLLEENGVTELPTTYDELVEVNKTLTDKGLMPLALGAKDGWHLDDIFVWLSNQYGEGDVYEAAEGKKSFTDETFVKTLEAWQQMIDDGLFQDGAVGTSTYPDARDNYFYSRKSAFFPTGSWHVSAVLPNDETKGTSVENDELGMMEFPTVGDNATGPTTGVDFALAVNKDSKKQEAAMKFVEFMTTGAGQQEWINTLQGAPVAKGMEVQVPEDATESAKESIALVTEGQSEATLNRKLTSQELNDEIGVQMQNIYTGDATVESALEAIQQVSESIER